MGGSNDEEHVDGLVILTSHNMLRKTCIRNTAGSSIRQLAADVLSHRQHGIM